MKNTFSIGVVIASTVTLTCSGMAHGQVWKDEEARVERSYIPTNGYVPDEATAAAVAEAILVPIYGKESIDRQKPFFVSLEKDVWTVSGRLRQVPNHIVVGGVFLIQISRQDGRVRFHTHGK
jgi:hypothetical protein